AYANALNAAETLYQSCIFLDGKAAELSETGNLAQKMTYVLARTGKLPQASENLEKSRARGLTESLNRDRADLKQLEQVKPKLYEQYRTITEQLRALENQQRDRMTSSDRHNITPEVLRETATNLRQQLNNLIQEIRQVPGYEAFLTLPTFQDVRQAAKSDLTESTLCERPLVYLTTTSAGSLALIVTPEDVQSIWLNDLNQEQLQGIVQTWFASYNQSQTDHQSWLDAIDITTRQLWEPLMQPLIQSLKTQNIHQATLIPTGLLSFLPLHAAWTPDENCPTQRHYALDDIYFTYAPNAKSLTAAQTIAQSIQPTTILAIDNPTQNLPNSGREINAAIDSFPNPIVLRHAEATVENVRSKLTEASIVHFSCHGTANLNEPLNSGLEMSDGLLILRDILALNLAEKGGIRLAILSACETGLNGIENADEAISLPTGLLQAGVAAVIASFWSVDELSTMILLIRFYDFWRKDDLEPSIALHQAQLWVRDTTSQEKANYFKPTQPELFQKLILHPPDYFAHPFHWSAFSYTGV
ncbi:MAG: CHAT domain-containing protein, partial [Alkalinema sp. CAN_BIN05]|nr:CHAT domain-containing protein [Alkalinema sp. CAN_BIN05]